MKFPLFSRMPRYKRFDFTPRYYDPVKEDIQNRMTRIEGELRTMEAEDHRRQIQHAYSSRLRRNKSTDFMQLVLILIFLCTFFGWIYFGNAVFYVFIVVFPVYLYFRTRRYFQ